MSLSNLNAVKSSVLLKKIVYEDFTFLHVFKLLKETPKCLETETAYINAVRNTSLSVDTVEEL